MNDREEMNRLKAQLREAGVELISETRVRVPVRADLKMIGSPKISVAMQEPEEGKDQDAFAPQPGDYVRATFRALSRTVFPADLSRYRVAWLDFTVEGVLEEAAELLAGAVVYPDHDHSVEAWLGVVEKSYWSDADEGLAVPGINAELKLDAVVNPKIVRGVISTPPTVKAGSVAIEFEFEPSHPDLKSYDFWDYQGEDLEGHQVRCIVTKIHGFGEYSLVWSGADPNAIKLGRQATPGKSPTAESYPAGGSLNQPNPAGSATARSAENTMERGGAPDKEAIMLNAELLKRARALFVTPPAGIEKMAEADLLALVIERGEAIAAELADLRPRALAGDAMLEAKVAETKRVAQFAELGTAEGELPPVMVRVIEAMTPEELDQALKDYQKKADARAPLKCAECGSTDVSRRSSVEVPPMTNDGEKRAGMFKDPVAERLAAKYQEGGN